MNMTFQPVVRNTLVKALDLAIRGLPRKLQPVPTLVDADAARALLFPELIKLEALAPDHNDSTAGQLAAALVSLHLRPRCRAFWEDYINNRWTHDSRGYDAVGVLKALMEDCKVQESISRSPGAQLLQFRAGLTLALHVADHPGHWIHHRFGVAPADCDVVRALEEMRISLGQVYTPAGFIDPGLLRPEMKPVAPPEFGYALDLDAAVRLAQADATSSVREVEIVRCRAWLGRQSIPRRLMNPAVMAAALQTVAANPELTGVWESVFAEDWQRKREGGLDVAGRIHQSVQAYHAEERTPESAALLYRRCQSALKAKERETSFPDGWSNLPKAARDEDLSTAWAALGIDFEPTIEWSGRLESHPASPTKPHQAKQVRTFTTPHETGERAEKYFSKHYQTLVNNPRARLINHRNKGKGYDFLELVETDGEEVKRYNEVKGALAPNASFRLTDCQWRTACLERGRYTLVLIDNLGSGQPNVRMIDDPADCLRPRREVVMKPEVSWHLDAAHVEGHGHCIPNPPLETEDEG